MDTSIMKYKVRPGTMDLGKEYEIKMAALLSLRCVFEEVAEMWMASNAEGVGAFDDLILRIRTNHEVTTYMVQLKHQSKARNILEQEFLSLKGDFSLLKYFKDIDQVYKSIKCQTSEDNIVKQLGKFSNISFVLYTNRGVNNCSFLKPCDNRNLSFISTGNHIGTPFYRLDKYYLPDCHTLNVDNDTNLYLLSNQVNARHVDKEIEEEFLRIGLKFNLKLTHIRGMTEKFIKFIADWAKGILGGHYGLTKKDVLCKLAEIIFTQNRVTFSQYPLFEGCPNESEELWSKIVMKKSVTIVDLNEMVWKFLLKCVSEEVRKYCSDCTSWTGNVSAEAQGRLYQNIVLKATMLKMVGNNGKISALDVYNCLWCTGRCPLILEINEENEYWHIINTLKLSQFFCNIIILNKTNDFPKCATDVKHFCSLEDVDEEDRSEILQNQIKIQARSSLSKLGEVIDKSMFKHIKCHDIVNILQSSFNIGPPLKPLLPYFIPRSVYKIFVKSRVLAELTEEICLLSNYSDRYRDKLPKDDRICALRDLNLDDVNNIRIILLNIDENIEPGDLEKFTEKPIHCLKFCNRDVLEWNWSSGSVKCIKPFCTQVENEFRNNVHLYLSKPINIISEVAGMGKSVFMDYVSHQIPSNKWVLKIDLNKHQKYFRTVHCKDPTTNASAHLGYFRGALYDDHPKLAELVFQKLLASKDVTVILDGFDEVAVLYKEEIVNIIRSLRRDGFNMWITTRPHEKPFLENECNAFAMSLKPFTSADQEQFLIKYFLSYNPMLSDVNDVKVFVQKLLKVARKYLLDSDTAFTGIPLQTQLLADFFNSKFQGHVENLSDVDFHENFDLLLLYENFIEQKFNILCEKFGEAMIDTHMFLKEHQSLLALKLVFQLNGCQYADIYRSLKEYYKTESNLKLLQRDGVIMIDEGQNISCIHRTYAEYLGARWLADNVNNENKRKREFAHDLIKKRCHGGHKFLFSMYDRMLAKDCPLHMALINGQLKEVGRIIKCDPGAADATDKAGRSILHIQALYGVQFPREFDQQYACDLIRKGIDETLLTDSYLVTSTDIMGYSPLDCALANRCLIIAERLCEKVNSFYIRTEINRNFRSMYIKYSVLLDYKCLFRTLMQYLVFRDLLLRQINEKITIQQYTELQVSCNSNYTKYLNNSDFMREFKNVTALQYINRYSNCQNDLRFVVCFGTSLDISKILAKGADVNKVDADKNTPLHYAILHEKITFIKTLLASNGKIDVQNNEGDTPLHFAFRCSNKSIIKLLLSKQVDVNIQNQKGETAMHLASAQIVDDIIPNLAFHGNSIIKLLVSKQAIVNIENTEGETPLHVAVKNNNHIAIIELLKNGANINQRENCGNTPIHLAVTQNNQKIIDTLISHGSDVNIKNKRGETVLHLSAEKGLKHLVAKFFSKGSKINGRNKLGNTALHVASKNGHISMVNFLLKNGANVHVTNIHNETALHLASKRGHCDVAVILLQKGIGVNIQNDTGNSSLLVAVNQDSYLVNNDMVKLLLMHGANPNLIGQNGETVLHCASKYGNSDTVRELLRRNVKVNQTDKEGNTPLHLTLKAKRMGGIKLRFSDTETLKVVNMEQPSTFVQVASMLCKDVATRILKEEDPENPNALIYLATMQGHVETAALLIKNGADVNAEDKLGKTPLHYAAENFYNEIVVNLLRYGAHIDKQDPQGDTATHLAFRKGHKSTANLLLSYGADSSIVNKRGLTPNRYAIHNSIAHRHLSGGN